MAFMTIEQEAADLLVAGATPEQIDEMENSLKFCLAGMALKNGKWEISPAVKRVLRDVPPDHALHRFHRGVEVCKAARRLCLV
jgi:hypothetical protein